ncbi:MAG TPA: hypothetical protein DEA99_07325 [Candidatus Omnitrophica bacterium]|nr:hypothetical protein [Candidatus Omnitrophota bacterium]
MPDQGKAWDTESILSSAIVWPNLSVPLGIFSKEIPTLGSSQALAWGTRALAASQRFLAARISGLLFLASSINSLRFRLKPLSSA